MANVAKQNLEGETLDQFKKRAGAYVFKKAALGGLTVGLGALGVVSALNFEPLKKPTEALIGAISKFIQKFVPDSIDGKIDPENYDRAAKEITTNSLETIIGALVVGTAIATSFVKFGMIPVRGKS